MIINKRRGGRRPGTTAGPGPLRGCCARWTVPRQAVLDFLSRTPGHWSAKDVHRALRGACPGIGLMTVYRTLDLLERTGVVHKIAVAGGQAHYELRPGDKMGHHHHLVCTSCGRIVDYNDFVREELELVRKTERSLARRHGFRIQDHNIEFLGLCKGCQERGVPARPDGAGRGKRMTAKRTRRGAGETAPAGSIKTQNNKRRT